MLVLAFHADPVSRIDTSTRFCRIVRADLKELIDLNLEGAPYAYAPMGNDREETKGYRFWDSG